MSTVDVPKCYGTTEYYNLSYICKGCLEYINCGLVKNKKERKINRKILIERDRKREVKREDDKRGQLSL